MDKVVNYESLQAITDIIYKVKIYDLKKIPKDAKFITMPDMDDGNKIKVNIIREYMSKKGKQVGGKAYFECPTCNKRKLDLFYPYQIIPLENRKWQCYKCTQNDPNIGVVLFDSEEIAEYISKNNNGESVTKHPMINLIAVPSQYDSTRVNSTSYKRVADRIVGLFRSKGRKLNPSIEDVLRNKSVVNKTRVEKTLSNTRKDFSLNEAFVKLIHEELIEAGGKPDKETEILDNLLLYRAAIINKKIRYYSAIADVAMYERTYTIFDVLLKSYIEHYKFLKRLSKEEREQIGKTDTAYFKELCEFHKNHNLGSLFGVRTADEIYIDIFCKQAIENEETKPKKPLPDIDIFE